MFGLRPDGKQVKDVDPIQRIMPMQIVTDERFCDGFYFVTASGIRDNIAIDK